MVGIDIGGSPSTITVFDMDGVRSRSAGRHRWSFSQDR